MRGRRELVRHGTVVPGRPGQKPTFDVKVRKRRAKSLPLLPSWEMRSASFIPKQVVSLPTEETPRRFDQKDLIEALTAPSEPGTQPISLDPINFEIASINNRVKRSRTSSSRKRLERESSAKRDKRRHSKERDNTEELSGSSDRDNQTGTSPRKRVPSKRLNIRSEERKKRETEKLIENSQTLTEAVEDEEVRKITVAAVTGTSPDNPEFALNLDKFTTSPPPEEEKVHLGVESPQKPEKISPRRTRDKTSKGSRHHDSASLLKPKTGRRFSDGSELSSESDGSGRGSPRVRKPSGDSSPTRDFSPHSSGELHHVFSGFSGHKRRPSAGDREAFDELRRAERRELYASQEYACQIIRTLPSHQVEEVIKFLKQMLPDSPDVLSPRDNMSKASKSSPIIDAKGSPVTHKEKRQPIKRATSSGNGESFKNRVMRVGSIDVGFSGVSKDKKKDTSRSEMQRSVSDPDVPGSGDVTPNHEGSSSPPHPHSPKFSIPLISTKRSPSDPPVPKSPLQRATSFKDGPVSKTKEFLGSGSSSGDYGPSLTKQTSFREPSPYRGKDSGPTSPTSSDSFIGKSATFREPGSARRDPQSSPGDAFKKLVRRRSSAQLSRGKIQAALFQVDQDGSKSLIDCLHIPTQPNLVFVDWIVATEKITLPTLPGVILHALNQGTLNHKQLASIILVWANWEPVEKLLQRVIDCYHKGQNEDEKRFLRMRVTEFLCVWIDTNVFDFKEKSLFQGLYDFIKELSCCTESVSCAALLAKTYGNAQTLLKQSLSGYCTTNRSKVAVSEMVANCPEANLLELSPLDFNHSELARQITLFNHKQYLSIRNEEFLKNNFNNPKTSRKLSKLGDFFNMISLWIGTEITLTLNLKKRVAVIQQFIQLGSELKRIKNWHAFLAVITGLTQFPVSRLKQTWKQVPSQAIANFEKLQEFATPIGNFKNLRPLHDMEGGILCPVIFLKDITLINEGNTDFVKDYVNIHKIEILGTYLWKFNQLRSNTFDFCEVESIQKFLELLCDVTPDEVRHRTELLEGYSRNLENSSSSLLGHL